MTKTQKTKLREQRDRQAAYRKRLKEQRMPTSVDLAKVTLHFMITRSATSMEPQKWLELENLLVNRLVKLGFDKDASFALFDELHEKHVVQKYKLRQKFKTAENSRYFVDSSKAVPTSKDGDQLKEG